MANAICKDFQRIKNTVILPVRITDSHTLLSTPQHISFKLKFTELVQDIKPDVVAAVAACEEVKKSAKLSKVFYSSILRPCFVSVYLVLRGLS